MCFRARHNDVGAEAAGDYDLAFTPALVCMRDISTDPLLLAACRRGDAAAWRALVDHFHPILEAYARRTSIPRAEWNVCITDLLNDEILRLRTAAAPPPRNLTAYLLTAVRHRRLGLRRAAECRERRYVAASENWSGEWIITSTCSAAALRASAGGDPESHAVSPGVARLARALDAGLSSGERIMLGWIAEGIPRALIAEWLGISHDACAKRAWRLCQRLRARAEQERLTFAPRERRDVDRVLRRAGYGV
jgi:DNA-directed RNA polymerase specialized sigma24 family protein